MANTTLLLYEGIHDTLNYEGHNINNKWMVILTSFHMNGFYMIVPGDGHAHTHIDFTQFQQTRYTNQPVNFHNHCLIQVFTGASYSCFILGYHIYLVKMPHL